MNKKEKRKDKRKVDTDIKKSLFLLKNIPSSFLEKADIDFIEPKRIQTKRRISKKLTLPIDPMGNLKK
ncbi:MAG: hypothetical protein U9O20_01275 [Patescibacteria group bacterium]|nr:hypothetical protein [Patescibacteria group bacterium]